MTCRPAADGTRPGQGHTCAGHRGTVPTTYTKPQPHRGRKEGNNMATYRQIAQGAQAATLAEAVTARILAAPTRSAWSRGVQVYALELLEDWEGSGRDYLTEADLLNGARDWSAYSWGGSSLIYDSDIADRLCTPSELKRTRGGERRPNAREEWLDTQARALFQAARLIMRAAREAVREEAQT